MTDTTDFERINAKRVERIISDLNLIAKSARSNKVGGAELGKLLDPIPAWFIEASLTREPDSGESKPDTMAPPKDLHEAVQAHQRRRGWTHHELPKLVAEIPEDVVGAVATLLVNRLCEAAAAKTTGAL